jgi:hypothetical protein
MKLTALLASAAALSVANLWSPTSSAQPPTSDRGETEMIRPNRPLLIAGGAVLAASYIPPVIVAATSDRGGDEYLYIPIAGPWIDLGERGGCGPNPCGEEAVYKTLLIGTGIAHLVGTGLVISSLVVPEERTRRNLAAASTKPMVLPAMMGRGGSGISVVGRF